MKTKDKNRKNIFFLQFVIFMSFALLFGHLISYAEDTESHPEEDKKEIGHQYPLKGIYNRICEYFYDSPSLEAKDYKINVSDSCFIVKNIIYISDNKFYEINLNSSEKPAYIPASVLKNYVSLYDEWLEKEKEREKNKEIENKKYEENSNKFGKNIAKAINDKKIFIGMTKEQVKLSWGEPKDINRTVVSSGVHEQWVYNDDTYIYFENDVLTGWQDKVK